MTHKRSLVQIQYGPFLDHIEPCFTAGFDFLCTRSFCGQCQALRERNPLLAGEAYLSHRQTSDERHPSKSGR